MRSSRKCGQISNSALSPASVDCLLLLDSPQYPIQAGHTHLGHNVMAQDGGDSDGGEGSDGGYKGPKRVFLVLGASCRITILIADVGMRRGR